MYGCVLCDKKWEDRPQRVQIVVHFYEGHRTNLSFTSDEDVYMLIQEYDIDGI